MAKHMLIDAAHAEETRVVVVDGNKLEEFDFESANKALLKGNIYLAKVTRVEPSLQAAFVEYGGGRHGFLAFNEIHPDYYQIPVSDRQALLEQQAAEDVEANGGGATGAAPAENGEGDAKAAAVETVSGQEEEEITRRPRSLPRYRIQEVIKRRQILLVQVTKEERGTKGAALTTYISLAGRYCVLMPNTTRGGGISRKIQSSETRKRLRSVIDSLKLPGGMAVILRTAGQSRTKAEIKRDYDYLLRLWETIRESTLAATAPALIHEEANLIKRSIRDLYSSEIEKVFVEGDTGYRTAKSFMRTLVPSHARRVQPYRDSLPLFTRYRVESQLDSMHGATVQLPSGGYVVIDPTEALVAIDVNSGRATRERNIEETATKTNLEAASEIARQLRLRDLAGLVVVDFIDMAEPRNARAVERRLKDAVQSDRARIQMGPISSFGLLELSRQRLRPSLQETNSVDCPHCAGSGRVRSIESAALHALRVIEEEGLRGRASLIKAAVPTAVALYLMNRKRATLGEIEARYRLRVTIETEDSEAPPDCRIDILEARAPEAPAAEETGQPAVETPKRRGRRRARNGQPEKASESAVEETSGETSTASENADETGDGDRPRRRRRGRRGGRRQTLTRTAEAAVEAEQGATGTPAAPETAATTAEPVASAPDGEASIVRPKRRRRTRKAASGAEPRSPAPDAPSDTPTVRETAAETGNGEASSQPPTTTANRQGRTGENDTRTDADTPTEATPDRINGDAAPDLAPDPEGGSSAPRRGWWQRETPAS